MKTHRNVSPRQEAAAERHLFTAIAQLRSAEECRAFFRDLCTPAELQAMADRWAVVDFLKRRLPYREIHALTGVSVTTIGRVARCLEAGSGGYELAAQRLAASEAPQPNSTHKSTHKSAGKPRRTGPEAETGEGRRVSAARRGEVSRHG